MAVLPTPGSPMSTGLFFVLRDRIWMTRRISASRPMTGSSLPAAASATRSTAVLVQCLVGAFGRGRGHSLVAAHRRELLQELVPGQPLPAQQPARTGLGTFFEQGDEEVLDRDVLVLEPPRLPFGRVQQPGKALGDEHLTGRSARSAHPGTALEVRLDVGPERGPGRLRPRRAGAAPGRPAAPAAPAAGARRRLRCARTGWPWSGPPAVPPVISGSGGWGPLVASCMPGPARRAASSTSIRSSRSMTRPRAA